MVRLTKPSNHLMIISKNEIQTLENYIHNMDDEAAEFPWVFFANNPQYLMSMGFDEYVSFSRKEQFKNLWFSTFVEDSGQSMYREPNGRWHLLFSAPHNMKSDFMFHSRESLADETKEDIGSIQITLENLFEKLRHDADKVSEDDHIIWCPKLWTPQAQKKERTALSRATSGVLSSIKSEAITFDDLTWQQFEDVVAESIRAMGMKIHKVVESPQGGRDIIARGELIPDEEPITIAIEVKHKRVVDRPDVQRALWQNRRFPALMFVTSGKFTAGVLKEKGLPENRLRLFLKDGKALGDIIRGYNFAQ